ncbi:MAG: hypothetical protein ACTSRZ_09435 [Promethearchaeota archaeon]
MYSPLIAMLFGIVNTTALHLAKSMERHGIEIFDQIRAKIKSSKENSVADVESRIKKPVIYIIGLIINQTPPLWALLSNMFSGGNSSYFTSMFGIGLIILMIYSVKILKEPIKKIEYIGAVLLILGTLTIGIENLYRPEPQTELNLFNTWLIIGIFILISIIFIIVGHVKNKPILVGILFGAVAGGCGGLDPFFKSMGQTYGVEEAGLLPDFSNPYAVIVWIASFGLGTAGFLITQWGFAKKTDASILVPTYNSIYIVLPVIVYLFAYPGEYQIFITTILGFALIIIGIILMQAFRKSTAFELQQKIKE